MYMYVCSNWYTLVTFVPMRTSSILFTLIWHHSVSIEAPDGGRERLSLSLKVRTATQLNWYESPTLRLPTSFCQIVSVAEPVLFLIYTSCLVFPPPVYHLWFSLLCHLGSANDSIKFIQEPSSLSLISWAPIVFRSLVLMSKVEGEGEIFFCVILDCNLKLLFNIIDRENVQCTHKQHFSYSNLSMTQNDTWY